MRSIELFAGCGGLALGLSRAGFAHHAVIEQDLQAHSTLSENKRRGVEHFSDWPLLHADVCGISYSDVPNNIDLVSGGPPCQPFSIGGAHHGPLDPRNMWPEAIRCIRILRPKAFLFENVRGLLRPAFERYLDYVILGLKWPELIKSPDETWFSHYRRLKQHSKSVGEFAATYRVVCKPINTADYGAYQKRNRAIVMGIRSDITADWTFPEPTHSREALIWSQHVSHEYWHRHSLPSRLKKNYSVSPSIISRLQATPPSRLPWGTVRDAIADLSEPTKTNPNVEGHLFHKGARVYRGHTGSKWDEPAKALKAGNHGVPGGENILAHDNGRVRYFTIREMARLQGFPDEFSVVGSWKGPIRQIGNAVPVQVAELFGQQIIQILRADQGAKSLAA